MRSAIKLGVPFAKHVFIYLFVTNIFTYVYIYQEIFKSFPLKIFGSFFALKTHGKYNGT